MELINELNKYCKPAVKNLYIKGEIGHLDSKRVAIVGSRSMTTYGKQVVKDVCRILARQNITVVSGLMYGIDLEAHKQILKFGGRTIGVLGYGFNHLGKFSYSKEIANHIIQNKCGAVLSEFEDDQPPQVWTFPKRNRIVAALSDYVIIIEAGKESGTLITADLALEMGKDVYAVCGSIYSDQSYGCNKLLNDGAIPLYDLNLLDESLSRSKNSVSKSFHSPPKNLNLSEQAKLVFDYILGCKNALSVDKFDLMKNTLGSVNELSIALSELELNNLIKIDGENIRLN